MSSHAVANSAGLLEGRSVDEWILENLRWHGAQTLEHLNALFPKLEEARLLFAIDRLSRAGKVVISPPQKGDYLISARSTDELAALQGKVRLFKESQELGRTFIWKQIILAHRVPLLLRLLQQSLLIACIEINRMLSRENRWPRAEGGAESDSRRHGDEAAQAVTHERGESPLVASGKSRMSRLERMATKDRWRSVFEEEGKDVSERELPDSMQSLVRQPGNSHTFARSASRCLALP